MQTKEQTVSAFPPSNSVNILVECSGNLTESNEIHAEDDAIKLAQLSYLVLLHYLSKFRRASWRTMKKRSFVYI